MIYDLLIVGNVPKSGLSRFFLKKIEFAYWKCSILLLGGNENSFMDVEFLIWSLEFWWIEDPSKEEYGDGALWNCCFVSSLWRMCCWKTTSFQFPISKSWRSKEVLGPVHSDICGSLTSISNRGKRYCITLIDEYLS